MTASPDAFDLARIELAAEVARSVGELRLRVSGSSMLPAIRPGDDLVVRRCKVHEASVGDIVLFARHGRLFAHRVVACSGEVLVTRGDALAPSDPAVRADELLGKVVRVQRGSAVSVPTRLTWSRRLVGHFVRRSPTAHRLLTRLSVRDGRFHV